MWSQTGFVVVGSLQFPLKKKKEQGKRCFVKKISAEILIFQMQSIDSRAWNAV